MKTITTKEFDEKFDNGEDISEYLDFSKAIKLKSLIKQASLKTRDESLKISQEFDNTLDDGLKI